MFGPVAGDEFFCFNDGEGSVVGFGEDDEVEGDCCREGEEQQGVCVSVCTAAISPMESVPVKRYTRATVARSGSSAAADMTDRIAPNLV